MGDYALAVRVEEGRHFPPRDAAGNTVFRVVAVFDDEVQGTPFAAPSVAPFWGTTLAWEVPAERLKRVQSTGTGQLKLTVCDAQGAKFGWLVLDLRSAKRNAAPGAVAQWLPLNVTWRGATGTRGYEPPELRLHHALFETRELEAQLLQQAEEEALTQRDLIVALTPGRAQRDGEEDGGASNDVAAAASAAAAAARRLVMSSDTSPEEDGDRALQVSEPALRAARPPALPSSSTALAAALGGEVQLFRLSAALPRLLSGQTLFGAFPPSALFLRAALPPAFVAHMVALVVATAREDDEACAAALSAAAAPLVTGSPIPDMHSSSSQQQQQRLSHVPDSSVTWQFAAGVATLAHALAAGPRLVVELCVKSPRRADGSGLASAAHGVSDDAPRDAAGEGDDEDIDVLAVGTAPLAPLLHTSRVELDLLMLEPLTSGSEANDEDDGEAPARVALGTLHVTLALRELGVPPSGGHALRTVVRTRAGPDDGSSSVEADQSGGESSVAAASKPHALTASMSRGGRASAAAGLAPGDENAEPPGAAARVAVDSALRSAPEYEAAWELQVWKAQQQAAFRSALEQTASARMDILAAKWRAREEERQAQAAQRSAAVSHLEAKLQKALQSVQAREKELIAAGEAAAIAREAEKRELNTRLAEAEAAVRALQQECEHALNTERERAAEAARGRNAALTRAQTAEAKLSALQSEYDAFRASIRASPEGQVRADAAMARRERDDALARAAAAYAARDRAAAHVRTLADEMAQLLALRDAERQQTAMQTAAASAHQAALKSADTAAAAAAGDAVELSKLRGELAQLASDVEVKQHQVRTGGEAHMVEDDESDQGDDELVIGGASESSAPAQSATARSRHGDSDEWYHAAGDLTPHQAVARHLAANPQMDPEAEAAVLLRHRASLLGSGKYTRADGAVRRLEACIEELWREAERRKGVFRGD